ncbi:hypothetical protein HQQ80_18835 [Microbacteriaceae bacterium VKM Ac-2855]|nr:hypothetical protein [Microbacteriaceae bacterium VKM Ac-2855]
MQTLQPPVPIAGHAQFGPLAGLIAQPFLHPVARFTWGRTERPGWCEARYRLRSETRLADGSVRTTVQETAMRLESVVEAHLDAERARSDAPMRTRSIAWSDIAITFDGAREPARHAIEDGYEIVAFRFGDRIASSIFSVFDAVRIDSRFRTAYRGEALA